jgi:hypothetical protein
VAVARPRQGCGLRLGAAAINVMEPKYPNITVKLIGEDGNAFNILGCVNERCERLAYQRPSGAVGRTGLRLRLLYGRERTRRAKRSGATSLKAVPPDQRRISSTPPYPRSATTAWVGPQKDRMEVALRSSSFSMSPHMDHVHDETIPVRNLAPPPAATNQTLLPIVACQLRSGGCTVK